MKAFNFKAAHRIMDYVVVLFLVLMPTLFQLPSLFEISTYILATIYLVLVVPPLWRV
jgi:hypothetical protein